MKVSRRDDIQGSGFRVQGAGFEVQGNLSEVLLDRARQAAPVCDQEHLRGVSGLGFEVDTGHGSFCGFDVS